MDRRMLLAMVLAILVLLVNTLLFGPRRQPPPPQGLATPDTTTVQPPRPLLEPESGTPPPIGDGLAGMVNVAAEGDAPPRIHVETKTVSIELDPVGGTIRSWKLKQYTDAAGLSADLVRTPSMGTPWFVLHDGSRVLRTDSTRFTAAVDRLAEETVVRFAAQDPSGIQVQKTFRIPADGWSCGLEISVSGAKEGSYWELGWPEGLPVLEEDPGHDHMAISSVALFGKEFIRTKAGGGVFGCASSTGGRKSEVHEGTLRWMGVRNRYFIGALLLKQPKEMRVHAAYDGFQHTAGAMAIVPLSEAGAAAEPFTLYLGPILYSALEKYGAGLERVQDLGPGIIRPFSKLLMKFFEEAHRLVPNYGFEILILSILIRLIFYPLTKKSMDSMKRMQQLKPELDRINKKYKDEPERRNKETLELYRKNKINPLGGCIPVLIQLPVLSGLYYVLANAVQLRKEPFALWIRDLSAPDTVARVSGFPINVLPLIMAGTMIWQQKLTPTDPRQASLGYIMPVFMTFLFYSTPSGLVFYWTISNLMTVLQQIWMNRDASAGRAPLVTVSTSDAGSGKKKRGR